VSAASAEFPESSYYIQIEIYYIPRSWGKERIISHNGTDCYTLTPLAHQAQDSIGIVEREITAVAIDLRAIGPIRDLAYGPSYIAPSVAQIGRSMIFVVKASGTLGQACNYTRSAACQRYANFCFLGASKAT
jgi:hypothetical protein